MSEFVYMSELKMWDPDLRGPQGVLHGACMGPREKAFPFNLFFCPRFSLVLMCLNGRLPTPCLPPFL